MFEAPRVSMHLAHESGKVVSPAHRPHLPPTRYPCYSFLLTLVIEEHNHIFGPLKYRLRGRGLLNNELNITLPERLRMQEPDFYREDLILV